MTYCFLIRAKGGYTGLVSCVALEAERITTQSQEEIQFQIPAEEEMEEETRTKELTATKSKLINENGVISLENVAIVEDDDDDDEGIDQQKVDEEMSAESEVEVLHHVPPVPPNQKKRIHEVGKEIVVNLLFIFYLC